MNIVKCGKIIATDNYIKRQGFFLRNEANNVFKFFGQNPDVLNAHNMNVHIEHNDNSNYYRVQLAGESYTDKQMDIMFKRICSIAQGNFDKPTKEMCDGDCGNKPIKGQLYMKLFNK